MAASHRELKRGARAASPMILLCAPASERHRSSGGQTCAEAQHNIVAMSNALCNGWALSMGGDCPDVFRS